MEASTNSDLALLATSDIRRFNVLAAKDDGCVRLTLGEPEFPTPAPVCEAVARSLAKGQTHYPPNNGRPDLLEALSTYMRRHGARSDLRRHGGAFRHAHGHPRSR